MPKKSNDLDLLKQTGQDKPEMKDELRAKQPVPEWPGPEQERPNQYLETDPAKMDPARREKYEAAVRRWQPEAGGALTQPIVQTMHHFTGTVAAPKLYIRGRSTLDGRLATTLRIRPSLIEDLEKVAVGPLYLLVDVAIQRLIQELINMPHDAPSIAIAGESMDPGVYDRVLLEEADRVPKKRAEYLHAAKARKAAANEASEEKKVVGATDEPGTRVDE